MASQELLQAILSNIAHSQSMLSIQTFHYFFFQILNIAKTILKQSLDSFYFTSHPCHNAKQEINDILASCSTI